MNRVRESSNSCSTAIQANSLCPGLIGKQSDWGSALKLVIDLAFPSPTCLSLALLLPLLWDRKSLLCWFLLFFICSPLPRSFPGFRFHHTPLFIPYNHPCFTCAVLCFQEPGFRGFDQFSLLTVALWLVNLLLISLSLLIFELLLFFCLPVTLLNSVFFPIHCLPSTLSHSRSPLLFFSRPRVILSFPLLSFYFSSSPPFSQLHQFCSQLQKLVII